MPAGRKGEWFASQEAPPHITSGWRNPMEKEEVRILEHRSARRQWKAPLHGHTEGHQPRVQTHTCTCVCVFIIRKMATTYDHRSVTRERKTLVAWVLAARWPTVGDWARPEAPLAAAKKCPRELAAPAPAQNDRSAGSARGNGEWMSWVGFFSRGFCAFWLLNFAELRPIYDWAGAAECQYEYLRPARAQEWVFLVFRFWRRRIEYARISARKRSASGGTGWPPTEFGSEGVKSHAANLKSGKWQSGRKNSKAAGMMNFTHNNSKFKGLK